MKRLGILLVLLGAIALLVGRATFVGHASAAPAINNGSVSGNYAFSDSFHDPISGQDGHAAGALVFDGAGGLTGVYSQSSRCSGCPGDAVVDRAPLTGAYTVYPDGSATLDLCISISGTQVRALLEGAFSDKFNKLSFVQVALGTCGGSSGPPPNTMFGTAEKL